MQLYNVEFFTKDLQYVGSQQISDFKIEYDYLSPDESTITFELSTKCNIDNIICIRSLLDNTVYLGLVTSIKETSKNKSVRFKPLLSLFDVPVVAGSVTGAVENWIAEKITETYINNSDAFQNMPILEVNVQSSTIGTIDQEEYVVNLLDVIGYLLKKYIIVIDFSLDFKVKKLVVNIKTNINTPKTIEADLPNILAKTIEVKTNATNETLNKITIINISEEASNEKATYYRDIEGKITKNPESTKRIVPVIFDIKTIETTSEEFETKALETATADLAEDDFNNLIELTMIDEDALVYPLFYEIGQKALVLSNGNQYTTYLTGYNIEKGKTTLVFGAIRLELTKKLKRRLKK